MQRNNKQEIRDMLIKVWELESYPNKISYEVFNLSWIGITSNKEESNKLNDKQFIDFLTKEGLPFVNLVKLCKEVYIKDKEEQLQVPSSFLNQLRKLELKGNIITTKGNMGRNIIEWNYTIPPKQLMFKTKGIIKNELKKVKYEDVNLMSPLFNQYEYQVEESWNDINKGSTSCYIGPTNN